MVIAIAVFERGDQRPSLQKKPPAVKKSGGVLNCL
jgi:hypothetical protein